MGHFVTVWSIIYNVIVVASNDNESSQVTLPLFSICVPVREPVTCAGNSSPGGRLLGLMFAGYVPLSSPSPYPIMVYFLANYRPHLSHFLENVIFAIPT